MNTATLLSAEVQRSNSISTSPDSPATNAPRRYYELDSMRGLAALIVVLCHFVLIFYP